MRSTQIDSRFACFLFINIHYIRKEAVGIDILNLLKTEKTSDIHLTEGKLPRVRINGQLHPKKDYNVLDQAALYNVIDCLEDKTVTKKLENDRSYDGSFTLEQKRFRIHIYYTMGRLSISLRPISEVPEFSSLNLPDTIKTLTDTKEGLILVTGVTGSGKSSTLASLINHINLTKRKKIITIEDPIEYLHDDKLSFIDQREVGTDVLSFSSAIRDAMREDPDIVLVGEMRDLDTITSALKLAETGHLVLSTTHTRNTAETFNRLVSEFSGDSKDKIKEQLASVVTAVISQSLVPNTTEDGRIPLTEIMVMNDALRNMVRKGESINRFRDKLKTMKTENGSQTFAQSVSDHAKEKNIILSKVLEYLDTSTLDELGVRRGGN
ncbi:PilT/PilU family type 4a pilus ATPase (plasmid) [Rossellomorea sp. AcN35-11]|nr:PilT/PilU family type 4a pilus ATPase [Rossellomorea aquimaris]WJV32310.1 PilT/PilU family type 4a pilus ATPase [Rossellomorea sp. AcN35-11]